MIRRRLLVTLIGTAIAAACGRGDGDRELVVLAASSLTDAFSELKSRFVAEHPGTTIAFSFEGSATLRMQVEHGAIADVIAVADPIHLVPLEQAGLVDDAQVLAENGLAIVVPRDDDRITGLADLPSAERIVLGAAGVPVGDNARRMLERADAIFGDGFAARVLARTVSEEPNVRLVLAKVALGEADAAIVYRTDAPSRANVRAIEIPPDLDVIAQYRIAVLRDAPHRALAQAFVAFTRTPEARTVLARHGFRVENLP